MGDAVRTIVSIFTGIIGLAILVALISKNSDTGNVIGAITGGIANDIRAADGPITGGGGFSPSGYTPASFSNGMMI